MKENYQGLTSKEVAYAQKKYGKNIINKQKELNYFLLFIKEFKDPMLLILIAASFISLFLKEWIDASIILFVVLLNVIISFVQEVKASKALSSLKELSSPKCTVKRDGKEVVILSSEVVVNDLIILQEGDVVPADARLISINELLIDESSLTGESFPINKSFVTKEDDLLRLDYVYAGSEVLKGYGEAIVFSIGKSTEIGKIATFASKRKEQTPLEQTLDKLSYQLGIITIVICVIVFIVSLLKGGNVLDVFISSISLGVAAIPEGLASVVTIVLSLGVQKMAKKKTIVSKLSSVETLGQVSVLCSDKTGTLTQNKMQAQELYIPFNSYQEFSKFKKEITCFLLCITASSDKGDPLERAIYNLGLDLSINKEELDNLYKVISIIPFSSEKKLMEMVRLVNKEEIKFIKGAPEIILNKCNYYNIKEINILTEIKKEKIIQDINELAKKTYRLIASMVEIKGKRIFVGVLALLDPLKEESINSIKKVKEAGISIKMITGDYKATALEIAKKLDIADNMNQVMDGKDIDSLSKEEFILRLKNTSVFARVSPLHKMKIVEGYQQLNEIVAMTGDGVNDAPSLKKAHVGIAMGKSGKEVAKESADIIIQDDNLSTIVSSIEEGRNIYINIKKAVLFLLSSNIAEILVMVSGIFFSLPTPLLAIHILFINLISDSIPALCLGLDKKDKDVMLNPPRKTNDGLFSNGGIKLLVIYALIIFLLTMFAFFLPTLSYISNNNLELTSIFEVMNKEDILAKSRTMALATLSICELFHMFGMSSSKHSIIYIIKKRNYFLFLTLLIGVALQIIIIQVPFMNVIFKTIPLSLNEWMSIFILATSLIGIHEIMSKSSR